MEANAEKVTQVPEVPKNKGGRPKKVIAPVSLHYKQLKNPKKVVAHGQDITPTLRETFENAKKELVELTEIKKQLEATKQKIKDTKESTEKKAAHEGGLDATAICAIIRTCGINNVRSFRLGDLFIDLAPPSQEVVTGLPQGPQAHPGIGEVAGTPIKTLDGNEPNYPDELDLDEILDPAAHEQRQSDELLGYGSRQEALRHRGTQ